MEQRYRGRPLPHSGRSIAAPRRYNPPVATGPLIVRFVEEDDDTYLVGEPGGDRSARVAKRRAFTESSLPEQRRRGSSERLLRWSSYALIGAVFGGVLGIALGCFVILAALVRYARLSANVRRWRRKQRASGNQRPLPEEATRDRMQTLATLGQGFLAILLGCAILFAIFAMR